jgi:hypothetical protein
MIGAMKRDDYKRPELQIACEQGYQQMHDHWDAPHRRPDAAAGVLVLLNLVAYPL